MGTLHNYDDYRRRPHSGIYVLPSGEANVIPIGPHLVEQLPKGDRFLFVRQATLRSFRLAVSGVGLYEVDVQFTEPVMTVMLELLRHVRVLRGARDGTRELPIREVHCLGCVGVAYDVLLVAGPMRAVVTPTGGSVEIRGVGPNRTALYAPDGTLVSCFLP